MSGLSREEISIATFEKELEKLCFFSLVPGSKEVKINESKSSAEIYLSLLDRRVVFWHPQTEIWRENNRQITKTVFSLKTFLMLESKII